MKKQKDLVYKAPRSALAPEERKMGAAVEFKDGSRYKVTRIDKQSVWLRRV